MYNNYIYVIYMFIQLADASKYFWEIFHHLSSTLLMGRFEVIFGVFLS